MTPVARGSFSSSGSLRSVVTSWNADGRPLRSGASAEAIRAHYNVGNDFYALWLDRTMTYSAALWDGASDLEEAQAQKLDRHLDWAHARRAGRLLDIGCGWGSLLGRLLREATSCSAVGLTLSEEQARVAKCTVGRAAEIRLEGWQDHKPEKPYNAITCIGALEHFVNPDSTDRERVGIYSTFFQLCREWTTPASFFSLQTSAYGQGSFRKGAIASIFPESDLPRWTQLEAALAGSFRIVRARNDAGDYARTCREWLIRLDRSAEVASRLVGEERVKHYQSFLAGATRGFESGVFQLLRIQLQRI